MRSAAEMVATAEVLELPAGSGRDDHLAGVRASDRGDRAGDRVRMVEHAGVSVEHRAVTADLDPQLGALPPRDDVVPLREERHLDRRLTVEALRERARRRGLGTEAVDVSGPVRGRDERLRLVTEPVAQARDLVHGRLAVIGHHDHGVPLEELVEPAGRRDEPADGRVAAGEHVRRRVRARGMRGVVVVREVEEQEVEPVARHEPAPDRRGVRVDRPTRTVPERERRAGPVGPEEVVEVEPLGAVHGVEQRDSGTVERAAAIRREVDRRGAVAGVGERLEERYRVPPQVLGVHPHKRVPERASQTRRAGGAEGRAVLDEPLLAAVPPDEVRDLVDVGMGSGRDRREADRRERGKRRRRAAERPALRERRQRRRRLCAERPLQHGRRQPVDHDEDELRRCAALACGHFASVRSPACRSGSFRARRAARAGTSTAST